MRRRSSLLLILVSFVLGLVAQRCLAQAAESSSAVGDRALRVETKFTPIPIEQNEPPLSLDLAGLMKLFNVPALSVAVIDDYKIAWAKGYGVLEAGGHTPVSTKTLFQACSISKTVTAAAALHLVQEGKLSLDEDVNRKLKSWKVPENEFTKQQKVTLRRLMTHTAGLTVHFFPGYAVGEPLPTLPQILNGEKPANTAPVRVDLVPGTRWRY